MGFNVDAVNRIVSVDHSHQNYCNTSTVGNPVIEKIDGRLTVTSIFKRTKGRRDRNDPGDNSPMLYALKGLHDLKTTYSSIKALDTNYKEILDRFMQGNEWDCIIPLPSSSKLTVLLAKSIQRHTKLGVCYTHALRKITAQSAIDNLRELQISSRDKSALRDSIKRFIRQHGEDTEFQMKYIKEVGLRKYINPMMWGHLPAGTTPPNKILLVDDMVTSGASLLSALDVIQHRYPHSDVQALTLFGSSR